MTDIVIRLLEWLVLVLVLVLGVSMPVGMVLGKAIRPEREVKPEYDEQDYGYDMDAEDK
jgi:hypothetical protein